MHLDYFNNCRQLKLACKVLNLLKTLDILVLFSTYTLLCSYDSMAILCNIIMLALLDALLS